jgi:hypothetical protein
VPTSRRALACASLLLLAFSPWPALSSTTPEGAPLVPAGYQALVGPLHEHSGYSDGWPGSTPGTYYASAAAAGNDFLMAGEHSDTLDAPIAANDECAGPGVTGCLLADPDPAKSLSKWDAMAGYAKQATTATFTGVRGFEWTSDRFGHINVYFSRNKTNAKADGGYAAMPTFYRWLTTRPELGGGLDGLATFNHPGAKKLQYVGGSDPQVNWDDFAYAPEADRQVVGVEVYNDVDHYGQYYAHVLDKGWHVGAVGAEDLGHRRSDDWGGPSWAKTVILSRDRSPAALHEAMQARRFYAVRNPGTQLGFTVDGALMGSRLARPVGSELELAASAVKAGRTGLTLEVVTSGGHVVARGTDSLATELRAGAAEKYYFLRVTDGAQVIGYSSPVWVQQSQPAAVGEWLAGDLHVHTCYSHDAYCPQGQKGSYFKKSTDSPLDTVLGPVGELPLGDVLDPLGLGDDNTDLADAYTYGGTVQERFAEAAVKGLDYLAITDHHSDGNPEESGAKSVNDPGFGTSGVVGVPGYENSIHGHAQMLGATHVYSAGAQDAAAINTMAAALRADGGLLQANHPADSRQGELTSCSAEDVVKQQWSYGYDVPVDSVEVWNTNHQLQPPLPAGLSNDDSVAFWECLLSRGQHVTATGGGDSHWMSVSAAQGIGNPTTWVFATERSSRGVLDAIRAGRTAISFQPPLTGAAPLLIEADVDRDGVFESMVGDTVPPGTPMRVRATSARDDSRVVVRANGRTVVDGDLLAPGGTIPFTLAEPGWVYAQLYVEDGATARRQACDPFVADQTSYCRDKVAVLAMTSAMYVATPTPCPTGYSPVSSPTGKHEDKCKKD